MNAFVTDDDELKFKAFSPRTAERLNFPWLQIVTAGNSNWVAISEVWVEENINLVEIKLLQIW